MSNKIIPILSNIPNLNRELTRLLPNLTFLQMNNENIDQIAKSEILIADGDLLIPHMNNLKNAKWVQITWAGLDKIFKHSSFKGDLPYLVTRFSGDHFGRIMSEYVITAIVNTERNMFTVKQNQVRKLWNTDGSISDYRTLSDLVIGILGFGQIGSFIAQSLNLLGATILCLGRTERNPENLPPFIKKYYLLNNLPELLQNCDYIVNVLPSTSETVGLLNGDMLKNCQNKKSIFINVGRGSIIKEADLINALNQNWISGAILDVFEEEPLDENSPLWSQPQVLITPHVSAVSRAKDIAEQFRKNYECYCNGIRISTTVDFKRGY